MDTEGCPSFFEKKWIFFKKSVDIAFGMWYYNTRRLGKRVTPTDSADVAELADALDLGSSAHGVRVRVPPSACFGPVAGVAELADAQDLKSCGPNRPYRFDPGLRH